MFKHTSNWIMQLVTLFILLGSSSLVMAADSDEYIMLAGRAIGMGCVAIVAIYVMKKILKK